IDTAQSATKLAQDASQPFPHLLPPNAASRSQNDAIEYQNKTALSNLKHAQSNYDTAKNQTAYTQLIATRNGVITARNIETGQVVAAGKAAYELAIAGVSEVVIGVLEQAITEMKVGQAATVR